MRPFELSVIEALGYVVATKNSSLPITKRYKDYRKQRLPQPPFLCTVQLRF